MPRGLNGTRSCLLRFAQIETPPDLLCGQMSVLGPRKLQWCVCAGARKSEPQRARLSCLLSRPLTIQVISLEFLFVVSRTYCNNIETPRRLDEFLWALGGGGGPGGYPCGGEMGSHGPPQAPIFIFCAIFYLFSKEFAVLAAMLITPCDSLSALLTVPCCTIDHLHSSRP